jgi:phospholipase C
MVGSAGHVTTRVCSGCPDGSMGLGMESKMLWHWRSRTVRVNRRTVLVRLLGVGLVATILASPASLPTRSESPMPAGAAVTAATRTPIKHVVVIFKENRSFDEYFGKFPGANGTTTALNSQGQRVTLAQTPDPLPNDIGHAPSDWVKAYDGGRMDGFDREPGAISATGKPLALSQMSESQIPNYWAYARTYALGDNLFADWKGMSFANNLYEIAAQAGRYDPNLGGATVYTNPVSPTVARLSYWGCDSPADTRVKLRNPDGSLISKFPCFGFRALPNELQNHGISWSLFSNIGGDSRHNALDALAPVRSNPALWSMVKPTKAFVDEARAGTLPAVSWVVSNFNEHPVQTACSGENETVNLVNDVMSAGNWSSTAIFILWDEWGGFYDHVKPPQMTISRSGSGPRCSSSHHSPSAERVVMAARSATRSTAWSPYSSSSR